MVENMGQVSILMIIFGAGYVAVLGCRVALPACISLREALGLNELEIFDTVKDIQESGLNVGVAALSALIAGLAAADYRSSPE